MPVRNDMDTLLKLNPIRDCIYSHFKVQELVRLRALCRTTRDTVPTFSCRRPYNLTLFLSLYEGYSIPSESSANSITIEGLLSVGPKLSNLIIDLVTDFRRMCVVSPSEPVVVDYGLISRLLRRNASSLTHFDFHVLGATNKASEEKVQNCIESMVSPPEGAIQFSKCTHIKIYFGSGLYTPALYNYLANFPALKSISLHSIYGGHVNVNLKVLPHPERLRQLSFNPSKVSGLFEFARALNEIQFVNLKSLTLYGNFQSTETNGQIEFDDSALDHLMNPFPSLEVLKLSNFTKVDGIRTIIRSAVRSCPHLTSLSTGFI